ncbi:MAG: alpha/beta hydrolase [Nocardiopsaceae bacterium]|nr:alpha/beta hydrolase [Nocardiopsaceae bacterium]
MSAAPRRELRVESADGTRIHAEVHGPQDAPTAVLSHGWTCSTFFWGPVVEELGPEVRVVLYDQRGHGRSAAPARGGYSTPALADDLCAVLQATVPAGTRTVLGGHSMGAMTIMAAARRPALRERAGAILLASTGSANLPATSQALPGAARFPRLGAAAHRFLLGSSLPLGPRTPLTRAALHYVTMARDADPKMVDLCTRIVHACPAATRGQWGKVLGRLDLDEGLRALEQPTAIIAGTADRLTPIAHTRRMAGLLPRCEEVIEIPGAGHMTPLEHPRTVASTIRALIARHLDTDTREETA